MLAAQKGLQVVHLPGPRRTPTSVLGPAAHGMPELIALQHWIPDIADRDVFLCGPSTWTDGFERLRSGRRRSARPDPHRELWLVNP